MDNSHDPQKYQPRIAASLRSSFPSRTFWHHRSFNLCLDLFVLERLTSSGNMKVHTLPNLLTLIVGFIALIFSILVLVGPGRYLPYWLSALLASIPAIALYLGLVLYNFLVNLLLYQIYPRHYKQDYLIVLGAGLLNGDQVSKLLAARINRAIQFSNRQYQKGRKRPIIIMSGGQGPDEKIPEALAMARFAQHRGVPTDQILIEDQSKNTYQNMLFFKANRHPRLDSDKFRATFFSNNYHI